MSALLLKKYCTYGYCGLKGTYKCKGTKYQTLGTWQEKAAFKKEVLTQLPEEGHFSL